jgi:hypothetical protein
LINLDVPQEVVRKLLDHDSHQMVAHYAGSRIRRSDGTGSGPARSTSAGKSSPSILRDRSPRRPGRSSASRVRPRHCQMVTVDCRS